MDNVTHTLIGYALARVTPEAIRKTPQKQAAVILTSVLASNFPDLDFIIGYFSSDRQLAHLLHHRGHSHTLAFVPLAALASAWLATRISRLRGEQAERGAFWHLFSVAFAAALLHIAFDGLNSYGVHLFYPLDNAWYYGDTVYITEPLFFFALLPLVALRAITRWARWMGTLSGAIVLGLLWLLPPLSATAAVFGTVWLAATALWQRRFADDGSARVAVPALASLGAALLVFVSAGQAARGYFETLFGERYGNERRLDLVLTPVPGNPLCWNSLVVSTAPDGRFVVRRGALTLAPAVMDAGACRFVRPSHTAPLRALATSASSTAFFDAEFGAPLAELQRLNATSCRARAALAFHRAPYWVERPRPVLGDLRYDREEEMGFAEVLLDEGACLGWIPPWIPPRADVLSEQSP